MLFASTTEYFTKFLMQKGKDAHDDDDDHDDDHEDDDSDDEGKQEQ